jgi:hypothetical protein
MEFIATDETERIANLKPGEPCGPECPVDNWCRHCGRIARGLPVDRKLATASCLEPEAKKG